MSKYGMQQTLKSKIELEDIGTHSGENCKIILKPADVDSGICFTKNGKDIVKLTTDNIFAFMGCTVIGDKEDNVKTIEHLMATFSAMKVDNCLVDVFADEIPIFDGSAKRFVEAILEVGLIQQDKPRKVLKILKKVEVRDEEFGGYVSLESVEDGIDDLVLEVKIEYDFCGKQGVEHRLTSESFIKEVAFARTFAKRELYEHLQSKGLCKGASIKTGIGIEKYGDIINPEGLRDEKEFALHKMMDSIGDLYSLGYQVVGKYKAFKPGHQLNNALCKKLVEDKSAWELV